MKTKIFILLASIVCLVSCRDGLWNAINELNDKYENLDGRVAKLEEKCKEMNTNISSLQTLVSVILNNDYIVSITPIMKENQEIGYTITFAIHAPITIYHGQNGADGKDGQNGKDGKDGKNGENGTNGQDGKDGADGITPIIGVAQDETDHAYYWTLNGTWLLDANGNRVPLTSKDGKDGQDGKPGQNGQDGKDGKDGTTPQLKIENGYWYVSTDSGTTWTQLGKAVGENGKDGKDGTNGKDGEKGDKGEPGYSMFTKVTQDDEFVYFTLYNGTILTVHKGNSTFDQTVIDNLVTSLTLDKTEVWMNAIGEQVQVTATTTPFPTSKVYWSSSDSTIVSVVDGQLTAIRTGEVTITAKAGDKTIQLEAYVSIGDGLLSGEFSISATKKVRFSKGRLQYNPMQGTHHCADGTIKPGTWRFAENQYDIINALCNERFFDAWSDYFYFGTSGYSSYYPWGSKSPTESLNSNTDWGKYNAIENGDNIPGIWRCLENFEADYILQSRPNAVALRTECQIGGISGYLILPDGSNATIINKNYSFEEWYALENLGAVFLPMNADRVATWYSSCVSKNGQAMKWVYSTSGAVASSYSYSMPTAIRLVQDVK